jgi:hypothetical protein
MRGTVATINVSEVTPSDQFDPKCLLVPNTSARATDAWDRTSCAERGTSLE